MKITVDVSGKRPELIAEHNGKTLRFVANVFQKKPLVALDVFEQINNYWARMPYPKQDEIFHVYEEIYRGLDQILSADELYTHLNACVRQLAELHPLSALESWISMDPSFVIPADVETHFTPDEEKKKTLEKTYIRKDYISLLALSVFTRCLMPIFGEYIESTRREVGVDFKETYAVYLLTDTGLLESPAVTKLLSYISQIVKEKHRSPERILNGNSSEDMVFFLLALVLVRKLCVSDVSGESHLVSRVYNFLYQRIFSPSKTSIPVREKKFSKEGDSSDSGKRSILESYRKRTDLSKGDLAGIEYGYEDIYGTALRLCPDISREEIDACLKTSEVLKDEQVGDAQLILLSWVFKRIHFPSSIYYMSKPLVIQNLAVLEAVLWKWGFPYLAILATSHMLTSQETMHISPLDSKAQIPQEIQDDIYKEYPYLWTNIRKAAVSTLVEQHPVLHAIDLVVDDLANHAWRSTASEEKIVQVFGEIRRKLVIFPTIKTELAKLILYTARHEPLSLKPAEISPI